MNNRTDHVMPEESQTPSTEPQTTDLQKKHAESADRIARASAERLRSLPEGYIPPY